MQATHVTVDAAWTDVMHDVMVRCYEAADWR